MKIQPDKMDVQSVTAHGPGWLAINAQRHESSILVGSDGLLQPWNCTRFEELTPGHFAPMAAMGYELVVFGSGHRLRFVPPAWLEPLMQARTGLETMDTLAAARTYNVLAGEGRKVLAALLIEPTDLSAQ